MNNTKSVIYITMPHLHAKYKSATAVTIERAVHCIHVLQEISSPTHLIHTNREKRSVERQLNAMLQGSIIIFRQQRVYWKNERLIGAKRATLNHCVN
ncbi:hypothetical protein [Plesiomonas shigelloides]|uniref:hypothetical protein n=1 Tax=Plesiomonas shigelloides TaxID=703 RepID=UPI00126299C4|nr:hypothetical protein [Plesiomonas shigelloides]KAB7696016.1 hypothetical protein GBN15_10720 [Plesiomonas shigelloides]